jgi:signal transduction histidine kinase/AmiR/NasT family two-component response regulator
LKNYDETSKNAHFSDFTDVILQDITHMKRAEEKLHSALRENERCSERLQGDIENAMNEILKQDSLLKAVNTSASLLMASNSDDFEGVVLESMKIISASVEVDRALIRKNAERDGGMYATLMYEWPRAGAARTSSEFREEIDYDEIFPDWRETLLRGRTMNRLAKDLQGSGPQLAEAMGIQAILTIPIFLNDSFWGYIGFDACRSERLFTDAEMGILNSAGLLIASAVERNEMTRSLIRAREEARASASAKSNFLANMSHEIRTPMNAIIGMTRVAMNSRGDAERTRDCLEKIENASQHLLGLINDVLDMSKIDANKIELERRDYSFRKMLTYVLGINEGRAQEKRIALSAEVDPRLPDAVIGDELRLSQVINNLLSNAVKFTNEDGRVLFSATSAGGPEHPAVEIAVEDNGIGIAPEKLQTLFNPFEQADASISRRYGGTGLGLAISRSIVEQMGGELRVESELGRGSRFSFRIPVEPGDANELSDGTSGEPQSSFDFSGRRILIAEDIEINQVIVSALLEDTGVDIEFAGNGEEAFRMFVSAPERYDMIYMDIQMPEIDGYEAARKIRGSGAPRSREIPIVAMTANAFAEDVERCLRSGMDDHIAKPVDQGVLLEKTARYMNRRRAESEKRGAVGPFSGRARPVVRPVRDLGVHRA